MTTKVQMWGNSLAVRIPRDIMESADLEEGDFVGVSLKEDRIIIKQVSGKKETLQDVVRKITPLNRHKEVSWGKPVGNEIW